MRVLVCGSREVTQTQGEFVISLLNELLKEYEIKTVIEGGANGVDWYAGQWADYHDFTHIKMPAQWKLHGKKAGFLRNIEMLNLQPELVVAFPRGESRGTRHTIREAEKRNIPVRVHELGEPRG